jgi:hypothetical protein
VGAFDREIRHQYVPLPKLGILGRHFISDDVTLEALIQLVLDNPFKKLRAKLLNFFSPS